MRSFTINKNDGGQRLDKFISKATTGMPKSLMYKFIRTKKIKLNKKKAHENDIVTEGDIIDMYIPDEFFEKNKIDYTKVTIIPEIVYEDENIILVNKRPGVLVHTGDEGDLNRADADERETLIYTVTAYLVNKGEFDPEKENSFAPALCNRIDRNTGGIVIAAKNAMTLKSVNEAIRENRVCKRYLAAVHGKLSGTAILCAYHRKDYKTNTVKITSKKVDGSKEIVTEYKALSYNSELDLTLIEVRLITGRTHQIRAHMAYIGHPLLGEGKYAKNKNDRKLGYKSQALYSSFVSFEFPEKELAYLNGRIFAVDPASIGFLKLFKGFNIDSFFVQVNKKYR